MNAVQVLVLAVVVLCGVAHGKRLVFVNRLGYTIWVGSLGNVGHAPVKNGGWRMRSKTQVTVEVGDDWAGRFWGRTGCQFDGAGNGRCETGDCGNRLECRGNGGEPPATLAEIKLNGHGGQDYYDISLVDGFNIPATISPIDRRGGGGRYRCQPAACRVNVNPSCPRRLRQVARGKTVACKSGCLAENTDAYCCRGAHGSPETCRSSDWPVNYPAFFKKQCPDAYSYAYDDKKSTFMCSKTGYKITFG